MGLMAQWEDEAKNRQVQFSIGYSVEAGSIAIGDVTPTKVTFICPESNTALSSVGVHTEKGRSMLADQFVGSGKMNDFINEVSKRIGQLISV